LGSIMAIEPGAAVAVPFVQLLLTSRRCPAWQWRPCRRAGGWVRGWVGG
jgi:hypothetical protein